MWAPNVVHIGMFPYDIPIVSQIGIFTYGFPNVAHIGVSYSNLSRLFFVSPLNPLGLMHGLS